MAETFLHGVEIVEVDTGSRTITTASTSVIGIVGTAPDADATRFPLNTPVLIAGSRGEAAYLDTVGDMAGTLPAALDGILDQAGAVVIVVRVEAGATDAETLANVIGGVNANTGNYEGVHALLGAESTLGYAPRILIAPGFTHQREADPGNAGTYLANAVVAELVGIAERLRGIIVADGPNATDADAIGYAGDFGSPRVYLIDPWVKVSRGGEVVTEPASARVAGLIAKVDNAEGFWVSPSNHLINGIIGVGRPISFKMGDATSRANLLNEQNVATIIRYDGYRLWGNRTLSDDPRWAFLCIRRTADILYDSLQQSMLWAVDRGITKTFTSDVIESVNAYIRTLVAKGALLGGSCWADGDLNTADAVSAGKVYFDVQYGGVYPAEHITFQMILTTDYIEEIFG